MASPSPHPETLQLGQVKLKVAADSGKLYIQLPEHTAEGTGPTTLDKKTLQEFIGHKGTWRTGQHTLRLSIKTVSTATLYYEDHDGNVKVFEGESKTETSGLAGEWEVKAAFIDDDKFTVPGQKDPDLGGNNGGVNDDDNDHTPDKHNAEALALSSGPEQDSTHPTTSGSPNDESTSDSLKVQRVSSKQSETSVKSIEVDSNRPKMRNGKNASGGRSSFGCSYFFMRVFGCGGAREIEKDKCVDPNHPHGDDKVVGSMRFGR